MSKQPIDSRGITGSNIPEASSAVDNSQAVQGLPSDKYAEEGARNVSSGNSEGKTISSTGAVYTTRYKASKGEASAYEKRFDPNYLIVSDERKTFNQGVDYVFESNESVKQLGSSISRKTAIWGEWGKLAVQSHLKALDKLDPDTSNASEVMSEKAQIYQKLSVDIPKYYPDIVKQMNIANDQELDSTNIIAILPQLRDRNSQDVRNIDSAITRLYKEGEPLVITALDFGSGDGRGIELWQGMADRLKDAGITLRVKAYDVVEAGLETYASRLTNPILPKEYSLSLKRHYGEEAFKENLIKGYVLDAEDEKIVSHAKNPMFGIEGGTQDIGDINALKKQYGEDLFQDKLARGLLPTSKDLAHLKTMYGFELKGAEGINLTSPEHVDELKRVYGEFIYQQKQNDSNHNKVSDVEILIKAIGEEAFFNKANQSYQMTEEDEMTLKAFYGSEFLEKRLKNKPPSASFEKMEGDYISLRDLHGSKKYAEKTPDRLVADLKKILGSNKYADNVKEDGFPTVKDYDVLRSIYGDKAIEALREKNPKFLRIDDQNIDGQVSGEGLHRKNMKHMGVYKHRNLEVEFLCGQLGGIQEDGSVQEATTVEDFKNGVGVVDMSLILYGSTSHISPKVIRDKFIEATISLARDCMVATLPGQQGRDKELQAAELSRLEDIQKGIAPRLEAGEIEYTPAESQGNEKILYATYTRQLLCDVLDGCYASLNDVSLKGNAVQLPRGNIGLKETDSDKTRSNSVESRASLLDNQDIMPNVPDKADLVANQDKLTVKQKELIGEGKNYRVTIALARNPADISMSWSEAILNSILKPIVNTLEKTPDPLKALIPNSATQARYYGLFATGMAEKEGGKTPSR